MSQENAEVIRRLLPGPDVDLAHALRNDDLWALASQAWAAVTHPDFETMIEVPSQSSTHVGVDGLREGLARLGWTLGDLLHRDRGTDRRRRRRSGNRAR